MSEPTISGRMALRLVRVLERKGKSGAEGELGRTQASLRERSARVPVRLVEPLLEDLGRLAPETAPIDLAREREADTYDAAGLVLLASPTLREGFERAFAVQRLWGDGDRFSLVAEPDVVRVRFRYVGASQVAAAIVAACALVEITDGVRVLADAGARAVSVRVAGVGAARAAIERELGAPVDEGPAEIAFARELFDRRLSPTRVVFEALASQASAAAAAMPVAARIVDRLRPMLADAFAMAGEIPSVASAAKRLGMSARTLQRRLAGEGTPWNDLVDAERRARAEALLAEGMDAKEVAYRVGFSDPGALARARRRWARE